MQLGRLPLCQLSYSRPSEESLSGVPPRPASQIKAACRSAQAPASHDRHGPAIIGTVVSPEAERATLRLERVARAAGADRRSLWRACEHHPSVRQAAAGVQAAVQATHAKPAFNASGSAAYTLA